jgi:3-hydroxybutyryl-CoA dehydrogenase
MRSISIQRVAVAGAGTMGQGIAQACAMAGFDVLLYDVKEELITKGIAHIEANLLAAVKKNKIKPEEKENILSRISAVNELSKLKADLIIEAIVEKLEVKQKFFSAVEAVNNSSCILTSNTSSLSITNIASSLHQPDRFAGLHFFNPAHLMKLVEIVHHEGTKQEIVTVLQNFVTRLKKVSVIVKDAPGFIVNRVARQFYLEALKLAEEGVSDFKTIDELVKSSGFKMGPFELMDLIGMDINFSVTASMYEASNQSPRFKPSKLQQQKVAQGELGRKTGKGFYEY